MTGRADAEAVPPASPNAPPAASATMSKRSNGIETVVVTARRKSENVQKVPVAVSVLSGASISQQKIVAPEDLNSKVPSLSVASDSTTRDSSIYTIRGQGEQFAGSEPAVITYFDEVPTSATGPGLLYDLQSLQVLKGPQGTLFGRNTTGGAILLDPQRPTGKFGGYFDETLGDYGEVREQGALNVPIVADKLMARFAFDINERDGFTKDALTGRAYDNRDYKSYRMGILARPNDIVENYFLFNYTTSNTADAGVELFAVNTDPKTSGVPITLYYPGIVSALARQAALGPRETEHDLQDGYTRIRSLGVTNTTTVHVTDTILLKNIFGYRDFLQANASDVDGTTLPIVQNFANSYWGAGFTSEPSTRSFTDEFQIQGKSFANRLSWIAGVYVEYQKPGETDDQDWFTQFAQSEATIRESTYVYQSLKQDRSRAAFGQFTYDFSDFVPNLKFTGGVRYTEDWRSQIASNYPITLSCEGAAALGAGYCNEHLTAPYHAPTGTVSLDYQITPKILLYVASRHGYKSGGFNVTAPVPSERSFLPEYVTDVEVGEKSDFAIDNVQGRLNVDVFRGMFTNLQENGYIFANGQELTLTENAGQGIVQGLEAEATIIPFPSLLLTGFYAYTDAYYTRNIFNGQNLVGIPFNNTPRNKMSITGTYTLPLPQDVGDVSLSVQVSYQSKTYFAVPLIANDTDPSRGQDGYGLLNLHADWHNVFGLPLDLSAFGNNLTNRVYKIFENDSYNTTGFSTGIYGEPLTFGFEGRYHF
jgi:iron complex outermembrane receptor protein